MPGLELAVRSMTERERALFLISYQYGYGALGIPNFIPAKTDLLFDIELISFTKPVSNLEEIIITLPNSSTWLQKEALKVDPYAQACSERDEGNRYYKRQQYKEAARCYNRV